MSAPWTYHNILKEAASYYQLIGTDCYILLTAYGRTPNLAKRGNFGADVFLGRPGSNRGERVFAQDWPRYYFDLERAKAECAAWLARREMKA